MATIEQREAQRERQRKKEKRVCDDYKDIIKKHPNEPPFVLFETLAFRYRNENMRLGANIYPITTMGVRGILIRNNLYTPKRKES